MNSTLPREVLEQIFTHRDISKKDLVQLQLSCKQWRLVAQRHLYKEIKLNDKSLYSMKAEEDTLSSKLLGRLKLLIRTLLFVNSDIRGYIQVINMDALLDPTDANDSFDYVASELATLVHLCPNITTLQGLNLSVGFYEAISNLYQNGYLLKLEYLGAPTCNYITTLSSYCKATALFSLKMKEISVIDGVVRYFATGDNMIQPEELQYYPRVEHLHLKELARIHLFHLSDYISKCTPSTKSVCIEMGERHVCVHEHYNDQSAFVSKTQIQQLSMRLSQLPLTANEMASVIRMFPSLESFKFELVLYSQLEIDPIGDNMNLIVQFFDYLSHIPQVEVYRMMFGISDGLSLLPHLAKSMEFQNVCIISGETLNAQALAIDLDRECQLVPQTTSNENDTVMKIKRSSLTIGIFSDAETDTMQASFDSAIKALKDQPIKNLTIGTINISASSLLQKVDEELMNYIVDKYSSLQSLTYSCVEFPSDVYSSPTPSPRVKHMGFLHLYYCKMTDDSFTKLSSQYEHVDQLKYSASDAHEFKHNNGDGSKIRMYLPYTTVNTIDLSDLGLQSFTIKVWANMKCVKIKVNQGLSRHFQVIIHCKSLKEIRTHSTSYNLAPSMCTHLGESET